MSTNSTSDIRKKVRKKKMSRIIPFFRYFLGSLATKSGTRELCMSNQLGTLLISCEILT